MKLGARASLPFWPGGNGQGREPFQKAGAPGPDLGPTRRLPRLRPRPELRGRLTALTVPSVLRPRRAGSGFRARGWAFSPPGKPGGHRGEDPQAQPEVQSPRSRGGGRFSDSGADRTPCPPAGEAGSPMPSRMGTRNTTSVPGLPHSALERQPEGPFHSQASRASALGRRTGRRSEPSPKPEAPVTWRPLLWGWGPSPGRPRARRASGWPHSKHLSNPHGSPLPTDTRPGTGRALHWPAHLQTLLTASPGTPPARPTPSLQAGTGWPPSGKT